MEIEILDPNLDTSSQALTHRMYRYKLDLTHAILVERFTWKGENNLLDNFKSVSMRNTSTI